MADYASDGTATPELKRGGISLSVGQTYRFAAYSFNNASDMGEPSAGYVWNSTVVAIPDLNHDFMTYDSGDKVIADESFTLPVRFTQRLCKLTVKISANDSGNTAFTNCTGVYIRQGGASSSWTIGESGVAANTHDSAPFAIPDNSATTFTLLVPFASARPVTVHFGTLSVGGGNASNIDITSSQSVQFKAGKSYTLTARFKKSVGINVPADKIDLGGNKCTDQDKIDLAKLTWADGNLKSTGNGSVSDYEWTTPTDFGYYYTFMSTYTGNKNQNGIDPCTKLNPTLYGAGWRTPSNNELTKLSRCTDKKFISNNGGNGMWFMNKPNGLFLPAAGFRDFDVGSGTTPQWNGGVAADYWSSDVGASGYGYNLSLFSGNPDIKISRMASGFSVRCVKGDKQ